MTHRIFIALPASPEAKGAAVRTQETLKRQNPNARVTWVKPGAMHITLQFLGELSENECDAVEKILEKIVPGWRTFSYILNGLIAFPNWREPRVIAKKINEVGETSRALQKSLSRELGRV